MHEPGVLEHLFRAPGSELWALGCSVAEEGGERRRAVRKNGGRRKDELAATVL